MAAARERPCGQGTPEELLRIDKESLGGVGSPISGPLCILTLDDRSFPFSFEICPYLGEALTRATGCLYPLLRVRECSRMRDAPSLVQVTCTHTQVIVCYCHQGYVLASMLATGPESGPEPDS